MQTLAERRKLLAARLSVPPDQFEFQDIVRQVYNHHVKQPSPRTHLPPPSQAPVRGSANQPSSRRRGTTMGIRSLWLFVVVLSVLAAARLLLAAPPHVRQTEDERRSLAQPKERRAPKAVWQFRSGARFRFSRISYGKYHCEPGVQHGEARWAPCQQPNPNLLFLYSPVVPAGASVPVVVHFHGGAGALRSPCESALALAAGATLHRWLAAVAHAAAVGRDELNRPWCLRRSRPLRRLRLRPRLRQARERRRRNPRRGEPSPSIPRRRSPARPPPSPALPLRSASRPRRRPSPGVRRHRGARVQRHRLRDRPLPPRAHGVRLQLPGGSGASSRGGATPGAPVPPALRLACLLTLRHRRRRCRRLCSAHSFWLF